MCCCKDKETSCRKPENLKGKPGDCSADQIEKCHGSAKEHPCVRTTDRG